MFTFTPGGMTPLWPDFSVKDSMFKSPASLLGSLASCGIRFCPIVCFSALQNSFSSTTLCWRKDPPGCHMWTTTGSSFAMCWNFNWRDWRQLFLFRPQLWHHSGQLVPEDKRLFQPKDSNNKTTQTCTDFCKFLQFMQGGPVKWGTIWHTGMSMTSCNFISLNSILSKKYAYIGSSRHFFVCFVFLKFLSR